ncbi:MAG: hypothetical protein E6R03_14370 [Hyphomicrobiaceae bacterium]|nr:MAG: hypothetical protein E6R03_14370 [Hyphomicrobiaceae bacterium]
MTGKPVPTLFDAMECLGFRFLKRGVRYPAHLRKVLDLLRPFHKEIEEEIRRRQEVEKIRKPVERIVSREKLTVRDLWSLQAFLNAHVVRTDLEEETKNPKMLEVAHCAFVHGFMLAVDLFADEQGIDLEQVPEQN